MPVVDGAFAGAASSACNLCPPKDLHASPGEKPWTAIAAAQEQLLFADRAALWIFLWPLGIRATKLYRPVVRPGASGSGIGQAGVLEAAARRSQGCLKVLFAHVRRIQRSRCAGIPKWPKVPLLISGSPASADGEWHRCGQPRRGLQARQRVWRELQQSKCAVDRVSEAPHDVEVRRRGRRSLPSARQGVWRSSYSRCIADVMRQQVS